MATVHYRDRVKDTTTTIGTDPIYLDNTPPAGYKSFYSGFYGTFGRDPGTPPVLIGYCMVNDANGEWEMGVGTYDGDRTITRNQVAFAIKANSINLPAQPVNFSAGTKTVFCTPYSAGLPFLDDSQAFSSDRLGLGAITNGMVLTNGTGGVNGISEVSFDFANGTTILQNTLNIPGVLKSKTNSLTISPLTISQPYLNGTFTITTSAATGGGSATTRAGGPLSITTGVGYLTGPGGRITIKPGSTGTTTLSASGAAVTITGGDTTTTGSGTGGLLSLNGGNTSGIGSGGLARLSGGTGTSGGSVNILGGDAGGAGDGGSVIITSGSSFVSSSGTITISSSQGTSGNGSVIIQNAAIEAKWSGGGEDPINYQLGFFGTAPVSKQSATTLAELITALQNYGLIS